MTASICASAPPRPTLFQPDRALSRVRAALARVPFRDAFVAAWLVLAAAAVGYADEHLQDWIPEVLSFPDDTEVVTDRAIGSTVRMFSISTSADVEELFADWQDSLNANGYPVSQGADELLDMAIEFSGPGIVNAKIIVAPNTTEGRSLIEFDATLN